MSGRTCTNGIVMGLLYVMCHTVIHHYQWWWQCSSPPILVQVTWVFGWAQYPDNNNDLPIDNAAITYQNAICVDDATTTTPPSMTQPLHHPTISINNVMMRPWSPGQWHSHHYHPSEICIDNMATTTWVMMICVNDATMTTTLTTMICINDSGTTTLTNTISIGYLHHPSNLCWYTQVGKSHISIQCKNDVLSHLGDSYQWRGAGCTWWLSGWTWLLRPKCSNVV